MCFGFRKPAGDNLNYIDLDLAQKNDTTVIDKKGKTDYAVLQIDKK